MMTKVEVDYLNKMLADIPYDCSFRVSDLLRDVFNTPGNLFILEVEPEVQRSSPIITSFLAEKGFVIFDGDRFFDGIFPYQSRKLILSENGKQLIQAGTYQQYAKGVEQESSQLKRLDWMLSFWVTHAVQGVGLESSWDEMKKIHPTMHVEFLESYRQQMIDKLISDGYLEVKQHGLYWVTLKGVLFEQEGGYLGEQDRKSTENSRILNLERHQKKHQTYMTWLTLILAAFAFLSIFLQSIEKFHAVFRIHIWVAFFLFVSGVALGTTIPLMIVELLQKVKRRA